MAHDSDAAAFPRLAGLMQQARQRGAHDAPSRLGMVHPCDALSMEAAAHIARSGMVRPVLVGPSELIRRAADEASVSFDAFECIDTHSRFPQETARHATQLVHQGALHSLMKGALHTDELMSAVVNKDGGLRTSRRISHTFVFDLPGYHKLLAMADCVVNIAPDLRTKRDILSNALDVQKALHIAQPKVGIVTAVESVNPAIVATVDARELVKMSALGEWPGAIVEGPFGFDNVISEEAARIKKIDSRVSGDPDLLLMPDLNAGNILYKSFVYMAGGECAGLVLGTSVPVVLTSRADSLLSRLASVALAVLVSQARQQDDLT